MDIKEEIHHEARIFGLDLMRAVAILMVVLSHGLLIFPLSPLISQLNSLMGFFGVEIFFVLSGFLIGRILYRLFMAERFRFSTVLHFLKRRWFRTLPNYFLVLLINIAIAFVLGYGLENSWRYFFFLQNFDTPMPAFFPESWSLSIEEFAYIFLPLALLIAAKFVKQQSRKNAFAIVVILLIFVGILLKIQYHATTLDTTLMQWNVSLKAVVIYRLDSIFIGVLFSWIALAFTGLWKKYKFHFAGLGILFLGFFTAGVGFFRLLIDTHPFFWNVVYLPMVSLSIAFFLPVLSTWKTISPGIKKPIVFVSLISYSMYLLHYSIILHSMQQYVVTKNPLHLIGFFMAYLIMTIGLSYLLFKFYEKPMTAKREKYPVFF